MPDIKNRIIGHGEEPLDNILFNPRNWRIHPLNQQNALKGILDEVGWVQDVIVNKRTGNLVDGHLRCQLAEREGAKTIPVVYVDLSEEEEALILSTLDPVAAMAATDKNKLDDLMASIRTDNEQVQKLMQEIAEKERLEYGKKAIEDAEPQIDKAEELRVKWGVESGQLWKLGEHRLICGDCTDKAVVNRLMDIKLNICVTDPPYGVLDNEWDRKFTQNDLDAIMDVTDGMVACFNAAKPDVLLSVLSLSPIAQRVGVWRYSQIKPKPGMVWSWQPIFYWRCGDAVAWDSLDWYQGNSDKDGTHPTQKPVEFFEKIINSVKSISVYDPFLGSGTTLIACERLGRKCRAVEISPGYVAVAIQRWVDATGGTPELITKPTP